MHVSSTPNIITTIHFFRQCCLRLQRFLRKKHREVSVTPLSPLQPVPCLCAALAHTTLKKCSMSPSFAPGGGRWMISWSLWCAWVCLSVCPSSLQITAQRTVDIGMWLRWERVVMDHMAGAEGQHHNEGKKSKHKAGKGLLPADIAIAFHRHAVQRLAGRMQLMPFAPGSAGKKKHHGDASVSLKGYTFAEVGGFGAVDASMMRLVPRKLKAQLLTLFRRFRKVRNTLHAAAHRAGRLPENTPTATQHGTAKHCAGWSCTRHHLSWRLSLRMPGSARLFACGAPARTMCFYPLVLSCPLCMHRPH